MAIYIVIFVVLLLLSPLKKSNIFYFVIMLFLMVFAGLRGDDVGVDTNQYHQIFDVVVGGSDYNIEKGWIFFNRLVSWLGGNYTWLLIVTSFFILLPVSFVSIKESPYPFLSVFIFYSLHFYLGGFNIMRQYLAVSLLLCAYYLYYRKKIVWSVVFIAIAFSMHYSSLFALLIFVIGRIRISKRRIIIAMVLALIIGMTITEQVISFVTFSEYSDLVSHRSSFGDALFNIFLWDALMVAIVLTTKEDFLETVWGKLFVLSILAFNATFTLQYGARLYAVFGIVQLIFLPQYIKENVFKERYWAALLTLTYCSFQFFRMLLANANNIVPYNISI